MPKIRTIKKWLNRSDDRSQTEYEIHYSTKHGFFGSIPKQFYAQVDMMSAEILKEYNVHVEKDYNRHTIKAIRLKCPTEPECEGKTDYFLKLLFEQNKQERNVIMVYFKADVGGLFSNDEYNKEHQIIQFSFALKYCTEVRFLGGPPKYFNERKTEVRTHMKFVVIDDTPENRAFLESTYLKMCELSKNLKSVLTDQEKILSLVSGGQLLLT